MLTRRQNPWSAAAIALTAIAGTAVVAGAGAFAFRKARRRREAREPIDTVVPEGGQPEPPRGGEERPSEPAPAPIAPAQLPDVILAGGVPLEPGWETVAWYRYPPNSNNPFWIRVDQLGVPSWAEDTCLLGDCEKGIFSDAAYFQGATRRPVDRHGHYGQISGAWRWTVVAGEATPLATGLIDGTYTMKRALMYLRYDRESLENGMLDFAAQRASDWIDKAYGL